MTLQSTTEFEPEILKNLWLEEVLPHFPEVCAAKIRADVHAMDLPLPSRTRFVHSPTTRYLRQHDIDWLRTFVDHPSFVQKNAKRGLVISIGLVILLTLILSNVSVAAPNSFLVFMVIIVLWPLMISYLDPKIRRWVVRTMGPLGCPLLCDAVIRSAIVGVQAIGGLLVISMSSTKTLPSSADALLLRTASVVLIVVAVLCFGVALASYFFYRAKIRNNYDIVVRVLEMPEHEAATVGV